MYGAFYCEYALFGGFDAKVPEHRKIKALCTLAIDNHTDIAVGVDDSQKGHCPELRFNISVNLAGAGEATITERLDFNRAIIWQYTREAGDGDTDG